MPESLFARERHATRRTQSPRQQSNVACRLLALALLARNFCVFTLIDIAGTASEVRRLLQSVAGFDAENSPTWALTPDTCGGF